MTSRFQLKVSLIAAVALIAVFGLLWTGLIQELRHRGPMMQGNCTSIIPAGLAGIQFRMRFFILSSVPVLLWTCFCYHRDRATMAPAQRFHVRLSICILMAFDFACLGAQLFKLQL